MKRATPLLLFVPLLLLSSMVHAQLFRAYVASYGNDANPCTVAAPCRLVPAALNAVASGGEIWMLDSANFNTGTVDINKSVSILAVPGQVGSIVAVAGAPAITIQTAGVAVTLRNITIANNAVNPGSKGIHMTNGKSLTLEQCVLNGLPEEGLLLGGNAMNVYVKDSEIRNGGYAAIWASDGANVHVVRTKMTDNQYGGAIAKPVTSTGVVQMTVTDSVVLGRSGGGGFGLDAFASATGSTAKVSANRVSISNVDYGILASASGATVEIGNSMIVRNGVNLYIANGAVIRSLGNNHISDGASADVGTPTALPQR